MAGNDAREVIQTESAPRAVGPYSQAIRAGAYVFTAGQVAIDPATNQFIGGDVTQQTRQVLSNMRAVLEAAGSGLDRVVKTTVFLTTMDNFQSMNGVYTEFFGDAPPARSTIAVAGLPLGALVEIECVALVGQD
jgi:2-iminobutanoate/2-iminopropanoate deaminase